MSQPVGLEVVLPDGQVQREERQEQKDAARLAEERPHGTDRPTDGTFPAERTQFLPQELPVLGQHV